MDLFHRKEVSFETTEIKKRLKSCLKAEKCTLEELVRFLKENYGATPPIHFTNLNMLHSAIDCVPAVGRTITLQYYRNLGKNQFRITDGDTTFCYEFENTKGMELVGKIIHAENGRVIRAKYHQHDCTYKMYSDYYSNEYGVRLYITDIKSTTDGEVCSVKSYTDKIESYLTESKEFDAISVYNSVCTLTGFNHMDIDNVHIKCNLKNEAQALTITEIEVDFGHITLCEAVKGKRTYRVSMGEDIWSWEFTDADECINFEFTHDRTISPEEVKNKIETEVREEGGYEINPEILDKMLSEITQTISELLEMMN